MIQTRDGVARVPRSQKGVALRDYFANTEMPKDLNQAQVFTSELGPVVAAPDPVDWSEQNDKLVAHYSGRLKAQMDEKGYYKHTLNAFAGRVSQQTGYPRDEMKALIVSNFTSENGKDVFAYNREARIALDLPVGDIGPQRSVSQEPEL
ncbi:MAG: hypothetical protein ACSHXB_20795 [Sulfitobacter sp.]